MEKASTRFTSASVTQVRQEGPRIDRYRSQIGEKDTARFSQFHLRQCISEIQNAVQSHLTLTLRSFMYAVIR